MKFETTPIDGVLIVNTEPVTDHRGQFARIWCDEEFKQLMPVTKQVSTVATDLAGTVRGLHFQRAPHEEAKYIRCLRGQAFVAVVDIRPDSSTHLAHFTIELTAESTTGLFVAPGMAQGYQTLQDDTEMIYFMSAAYHGESAAGYRFDDKAFSIAWPRKPRQLSQRDRSWEPYGAK